MKLYGIPNCNTVKKARTWLEENGIAYEFHDFKKHGVDEALLQAWLTQIPWEKLVNRAGMTWRALSDDEKAAVVDPENAIVLMLAKPSIIKRPVAVANAKVIALGFDPSTYERTMKR